MVPGRHRRAATPLDDAHGEGHEGRGVKGDDEEDGKRGLRPERGEDDGQAMTDAKMEFKQALDDAIAMDNTAQGDNLTWTED